MTGSYVGALGGRWGTTRDVSADRNLRVTCTAQDIVSRLPVFPPPATRLRSPLGSSLAKIEGRGEKRGGSEASKRNRTFTPNQLIKQTDQNKPDTIPRAKLLCILFFGLRGSSRRGGSKGVFTIRRYVVQSVNREVRSTLAG